MALIANVNRGKNQRAFTADDFKIAWDPEAARAPRPRMSDEEIARAVKGIHRSMAGKAGKGRGAGGNAG